MKEVKCYPYFILNYKWRKPKNEKWNFTLQLTSLICSFFFFFLVTELSDFAVILSAITCRSRIPWLHSRQRMPFRCSRTTPWKHPRARHWVWHRVNTHCLFSWPKWLNVNFLLAIWTSSPPDSKSSARLLFFKFKLFILYFKPFSDLTSGELSYLHVPSWSPSLFLAYFS